MHGLFDVIITKDDVLAAKPNPEPILETTKNLGCKPDSVLYVGDTEADIVAGNAAGTITVLFRSREESSKMRARPDYVVTSLEEVLLLPHLMEG